MIRTDDKGIPPYTKKKTYHVILERDDTHKCSSCGINFAPGNFVRVAIPIIDDGKGNIKKGDITGKIYCLDCQATVHKTVTGYLCIIDRIDEANKK